MKKNNPSDGILVFDRYYGRKPVAALLVTERVLFTAMMAMFSMLYVFSQYDMDVPLSLIGGASVFSSLFFSVLFLFVRRLIAIPATALLSGLFIWLFFEPFQSRITYFLDRFLMQFDGRFFSSQHYMINHELLLVESNPLYVQGVALGSVIVCALFSLLCAASMKNRICCLPSLVVFILLCVPRLISETLEFNGWLIPVILTYAAGIAIGMIYRNGLAVVKQGAATYRRQIKSDEERFLDNISNVPMLKRIGMKITFFSKYFTSGGYCAVLFACALCIGISVFKAGDSIDYSSLYKLVSDIGEDVGIAGSPFESGAASDYFTTEKAESPDNGLNISSPGSGDTKIIKVTFFGDEPVYLRGDIGIDFTGSGWTTPVTDHAAWEKSTLDGTYRPCEADVVRTMLNALDSGFSDIIHETEVTIEYLCETDVVFLPAYTADYSYFDDPNFRVFGDFVVRVDESVGDFVNSVQCKSLAFDFSSYSFYTHAELLRSIESEFDDNEMSVNDFYSIVVPSMSSRSDVIKKYGEYVMDTYLALPDDTSDDIRSFINSVPELRSAAADYELSRMSSDSAYNRYNAADIMSNYLTANYKYTLSGENRSDDPVMEFLTDTKRGHCSLYASALTLMLREIGIPARYCTGFSVYPMNTSLSTVVLQEKNLHAWVEVYLGELGWVTFDPTSSAINGSGEGAEDRTTDTSQGSTEDKAVSSEEQQTEQAKPEIPDRPEHPTSRPGPQQPEKRFELPPWVIVTAVGVVILGAAVALILMHIRSTSRRADEYLASADRRSSEELCTKLIELLCFCDITQQPGEFPRELFSRGGEQLDTDLSAVADLLEKASFSADELTADEKTALAGALNSVYSAIVKGKGMFKRYAVNKKIVKH